MQHSIYRMHNNKYLSDCLAIVTRTDESVEDWGLTRDEIVTLVKPKQDMWRESQSVASLARLELFGDQTPLLRVGSECMFGMFGDTHCDCEPERRLILRELQQHGGVYVHLPQEGQGMGLLYKAQELHLQTAGYMPTGEFVGPQDQAHAAAMLTGHHSVEKRDFNLVAEILSDLGLARYNYLLISNSPSKRQSLEGQGIMIVGTVDAASVVGPDNLGEYLTKWLYKSYPLNEGQIRQIVTILEGNEVIPPRAATLVNEARLALVTDQTALEGKVNASAELVGLLFKAIAEPINPSLSGAQAGLLRLLEQASAYDEFQYEFVLDEDLDNYVVENVPPETPGTIVLWHERNHYFYLPNMSGDARDLKIRTTYDTAGRFVTSRLIHKVRLSPNNYRIRAIQFSDGTIADLLERFVFADYDQRVVQSITYPHSYGELPVKIIIKRYSSTLRTLSIEGAEHEVRAWRQAAEDGLNRRLQPAPQDERSFAPKIADDFDLGTFKGLEFARCGRYNGIL